MGCPSFCTLATCCLRRNRLPHRMAHKAALPNFVSIVASPNRFRRGTLDVQSVIEATEIVAQSTDQPGDERVVEESRIAVGYDDAYRMLVSQAQTAGTEIGAIVQALDGVLDALASGCAQYLAAHVVRHRHDRDAGRVRHIAERRTRGAVSRGRSPCALRSCSHPPRPAVSRSGSP